VQIISLILNFFLSLSFTNLLIKPFKKVIPDIPNHRSSHKITKPRGGGIAFITSNLITSTFLNHEHFTFLLPLCFLSFIDDIKDINKWFRLIGQISTVIFIVFSSKNISILKETSSTNFEIILVIFISTAIINFCNFMDGIDGILSGLTLVFLLSATFLIQNSIWGIIGSVFGFLILNWNPSKIFMGDIGSNFLGSLIVWVLLNTNSSYNSIGLLFIAAPLLLDPFICLFRRFLNNQKIFDPHSLHLYQRLTKNGFSHSKVSIIYILASAFISISFFIGGITAEILSTLFVLILGYWLDKRYASNFHNYHF